MVSVLVTAAAGEGGPLRLTLAHGKPGSTPSPYIQASVRASLRSNHWRDLKTEASPPLSVALRRTGTRVPVVAAARFRGAGLQSNNLPPELSFTSAV